MNRYVCFAAIAVLACLSVSLVEAGDRKKVFIESTIDGTRQPCYVILPDGFDAMGERVPLLVSLHTWSGDVEQRNEPLEEEANQRGWIYLFPHFRGANDHPEACGSLKAQQDIVDAVRWAQKEFPIDRRRIYLTGVSGGGHMTLLMVGRHPDIWAAASAWVGISNLAAWHKLHAERGTKYATMAEQSCGGKPGDSEAVNEEYRRRSPLTHLHRAKNVPVDVAAGIHDGHEGSVPIRHSLDAFNTIAGALNEKTVSESEIEQLSQKNGRLQSPLPSDDVEDETFGRAIHLRRTAGQSRVTIFEGGHEGIAHAAAEWLSRHAKAE